MAILQVLELLGLLLLELLLVEKQQTEHHILGYESWILQSTQKGGSTLYVISSHSENTMIKCWSCIYMVATCTLFFQSMNLQKQNLFLPPKKHTQKHLKGNCSAAPPQQNSHVLVMICSAQKKKLDLQHHHNPHHHHHPSSSTHPSGSPTHPLSIHPSIHPAGFLLQLFDQLQDLPSRLRSMGL